MNEPNFYQGQIIVKHILTFFCLWSFEIIFFFNIDILSLDDMLEPSPKSEQKNSNVTNDLKSVLKENKVWKPGIR